ncbi:MAG: rod shape-determining protein MreC [Clostridiales bacterium]|nr:rod shape-determining protein MreC [Clostridiales bacterium]
MIKWMREHRIFTAITSVILILCVIIAISYYNGTGFIGSILNRGSAEVSEPVTGVVNNVRDDAKGLFGFRKISKENEALKEEIEKLEKELIAAKLEEAELEELRELTSVLNYVGNEESPEIVSANITGVDNSGFYNIFTINAGEESGIYEDCIVLSGNGLIGRVAESGNGYAKVVSIIDENLDISFQVLRDASILGVVSGDGKGGLDGYTLKADAGIVEGDTLITTGIGLYPEGIVIGKVTKVEYNSDIQLMTLRAETSADFNALRKVVVLI